MTTVDTNWDTTPDKSLLRRGTKIPFKSKSQMKKFYAMEARGEMKKGTAKRWAHETPDISELPEKKKKSKSESRGRYKKR